VKEFTANNLRICKEFKCCIHVADSGRLSRDLGTISITPLSENTPEAATDGAADKLTGHTEGKAKRATCDAVGPLLLCISIPA